MHSGRIINTCLTQIHTHKAPGSHLWSIVFYSSYKSEVEASAEAVLEEDGRAAAVEAALRDDSHPVTEQVRFVHVVGGHDHRAPCKGTMWSR